MKSELAQKLETLLNNMSQEEFDESWNEIVKLKFPSSFQEVVENRIKELERDCYIDKELKKRLIKENTLILKKHKL
jgi:hypothetical protein